MQSNFIKKVILFALFIAINLFLWFFIDIGSIISFESIQRNRDYLLAAVQNHYTKAVLIYIALYTLDAALFLPATAIMIMLGGFLFGVLPTMLYATIGATAGASCAFLATRYLFGKALQTRYHARLSPFYKEIEQNAVRYLLFARIIPIFPFFLVNILAGLSSMRLPTFMWATAIGIFPNLILYGCIGRELARFHTFWDIFTPQVILSLLILTGLSLVPLLSKRNTSC